MSKMMLLYLSLHSFFEIRLIPLIIVKEVTGNHHLLNADLLLLGIDSSHHSIAWTIAYSSLRYLAVHMEWS